MRLPAVIFALVLTACAVGQVFFPARRIAPPTPISAGWQPDDVSTIRFWWVAEDLATGTLSGDWLDRIQGFGLGMAAAESQPTNESAGLFFNGGEFLTNAPTFQPAQGAGNELTLFLIFTPLTPATSWGEAVGNGDFQMLGTRSTDELWYFGNNGGGNFTTFASGTQIDITVSLTNAIDTVIYKNGIPIVTNTAGTSFTISHVGWGKNGANNFWYKGHIQEIIWYSNKVDTTIISNLHAYGVSKYGY